MNLAETLRLSVVIAILTAAPLLEAGASDKECGGIVRVDEQNVRIFVLCPELPTMSSSEIRQSIRDIFERLDHLDGEYFISFFTTEELAAYKDDPRVARAVSSGAWSRGYLGEYYTHSNQLTLWPALPEKRRTLSL